MILTRMTAAMALGGFILITAATLKYAQAENAISPEATKRSMQVLFGLMLAAYANVMPKDIGNWQASSRAVARSQSALRVGGWSLTLAGLASAGLWAFAPLAVADVAAMAIVASALLITMGYGAWAVMVCRSEKRAGLNSEGRL
jgi:hypothetical protein